jgi:ABC-2 type transport system ATP-binding protein
MLLKHCLNNYYVHLENITVSYRRLFKSTPILENISLTLFPNEVIALVGDNGVGKSTLLKTIAGFIKPTTGTYDPRCSMAYLSDNVHVPPFLTPYKSLRYTARLTNGSCEEIEDILKAVGLYNHKHTLLGSLSNGQRQRFALAQALLPKADLLLLDEPFSGLDVKATQTLSRLLFENKREHQTILYATHEQPVAQTSTIIHIRNKTISTLSIDRYTKYNHPIDHSS